MLGTVISGVQNFQFSKVQFGRSVQNQNFNANFLKQNDSEKLNNELYALSEQNRIYSPIINFCGKSKKSKTSFDEFEKLRKQANIKDVQDLKANLREENLLGRGLNSRVYKFDSPLLDNWAIKEDVRPFYTPYKEDEMQAIPDEFDVFGMNFGQEIARIGDRYHILMKLEGQSHSVNDWSAHINNDSIVSKKEAREFNASLAKIAEFEQSSFDDFASKLHLLSQTDYKQDSINPNNLIIDYDNATIHIIDFFKKADPSHINSNFDLICSLLDFSLFDKFYEKLDEKEQKELLKNAETIVEKCNIAAEKYDLVQDETIFTDYLANVDKYFGFALENKGGNYRSRYERMKALVL